MTVTSDNLALRRTVHTVEVTVTFDPKSIITSHRTNNLHSLLLRLSFGFQSLAYNIAQVPEYMVVIPVFFRGREIIRMSLSLAFWCRLESWCTCDAATAPDIIGCLLHQHGTVNSCARATTGLDAQG